MIQFFAHSDTCIYFAFTLNDKMLHLGSKYLYHFADSNFNLSTTTTNLHGN